MTRMCLIRAASASTAASRSSGPSTTPPTIWPRSAILAEDRAIERRRHLRAHHLDRCEHGDFRQVDAKRAGEADGVLADVALLVGVGRDVERDVGDDHAARIGRRRHHRAVAEQPAGAQFRVLLHAPHAEARRCAGCPSSGPGSRLTPAAMAARCAASAGSDDVDDLEAGYVEVRFGGSGLDFLFRPEQDGRDQAVFRGVDGAAECAGAAGVDDAGEDRLEPAALRPRDGRGRCSAAA